MTGAEAPTRHVVVTGGAGFIGSAVCRGLLARPGTRVTVLDDLSSGRRENVAALAVTASGGSTVELVEGSVLDAPLVGRLLADADAVVHLAAIASVQESLDDPRAVYAVNVDGTLTVLEAARAAGGAHVLLASSSSVYGSDPVLPKHEGLRPRTESPYAATKLAAETAALTWQRSFGLPVLAFRFFNVYGPGQRADSAYPAVVPAFLEAAVAGRPLTVYGTGEQSRDFTFVDSVGSVIADAVHRRVTSDEPVDLGFGVRTTLLELIAAIEAELGHPLEVRHEPARTGDVLHSQAQGAALAALFPSAADAPLAEGLRATIAWLRSRTP